MKAWMKLCVALLSMMALFPVLSHAQQLPSPELTAAHERMLADPANLNLLYDYAQIAIDEGNFEAAIGALEGMLVIARNQPRVLMELGILYQRLGAPTVARSYLQRAQLYSGADSTVFSIAEPFLAEAENTLSPSVWSGFVKFGLRYQSNPSLGPEVDEILSGGVRVPLPDSRRVESDTNALLFGRVSNRYRLSERTALSSSLVGYGTFYDEQSRLDFGSLELTSGPSFESATKAAGQHSFRPHIVLRGTRSNNKLFEKTAGAGLDFNLTWDARSLLNATYQYRDVSYEDIYDNGYGSLRSGDEHRLDLNFRTEWKRGHTIALRFFGRTRSAERDFFEEDLYSITLRYSLRFANFVLPERRRMTLTPYVTRQFKDYGGPDPAIDPATTREDRQWRYGLTYLVPVASTWSVYLNLERTEVDSNIVNYDATNNLFMVGLQKGF